MISMAHPRNLNSSLISLDHLDFFALTINFERYVITKKYK